MRDEVEWDGPRRFGTARMPIHIETANRGRGVTMTGSGVVTGADLIDANSQIYAEERVDLQREQLFDMTGIERFDVSTEDLQIVAAQDRRAGIRQSGSHWPARRT